MKKYTAPIVRRRDVLSLATAGAAALAVDAVLPEAAVAAPSDVGGKRRSRYQANSSEVKSFYRVNRYPARVIPMLVKKSDRKPNRGTFAATMLGAQCDEEIGRRTFLRRAGLTAGALSALGTLPLKGIRKAEAGPPPAPDAAVVSRKNICTHCSVGCSVIAEVSNGVWIGQEPDYDSPINRGSHCCKGAAVRDDVLSQRRLRYPVKLVNGQWVRLSWDRAIDEIGDKLLDIRQKSGPDAVYWLGSAKFTNEAAYLNRKLAAYWGTE